MPRTFIAAVVLFGLVAGPSEAASIIILNADEAGKGFNDPTPVQPIGGNPGTTLGEQRLNVFRYAADIWGRLLESNVEIVIRATFSPIVRPGDPCTASGGILGAAGPTESVANFPGAPRQGVYYPVALANKLAGEDLSPGEPDIDAFFNSLVDNATCLGSSDWYYGLDTRHGEDIDLAVVLLHEFAHGLGMFGTTNVETGEFGKPEEALVGLPNVFDFYVVDQNTGLRWNVATEAERKASAINSNIIWDGPFTRQSTNNFLNTTSTLIVTAPSAVARNYAVNTATFGPLPQTRPVSGSIVAAVDAAEAAGTTTDGCSAFTNASEVAGKIALVDRGACNFTVKARNAQEAGAIAVIVANQQSCGLPPMGGDDPVVNIPAIGISLLDGRILREQLAAGVQASIRVDATARAGASTGGFMQLYAPCELNVGSSVYHWDVSATPNLLMEPAINDDLKHEVDLTLDQLLDIGWTTPASKPSGRRTLRRGRI